MKIVIYINILLVIFVVGEEQIHPKLYVITKENKNDLLSSGRKL